LFSGLLGIVAGADASTAADVPTHRRVRCRGRVVCRHFDRRHTVAMLPHVGIPHPKIFCICKLHAKGCLLHLFYYYSLHFFIDKNNSLVPPRRFGLFVCRPCRRDSSGYSLFAVTRSPTNYTFRVQTYFAFTNYTLRIAPFYCYSLHFFINKNT